MLSWRGGTEVDSLPPWLSHHTIGIVNTVWPSKLVDDSDQWTSFILWDRQRTDRHGKPMHTLPLRRESNNSNIRSTTVNNSTKKTLTTTPTELLITSTNQSHSPGSHGSTQRGLHENLWVCWNCIIYNQIPVLNHYQVPTMSMLSRQSIKHKEDS